MLIIRPEQFEAFQPVAEAAFVRRIVELLREENGEAVVQLPNEIVLVRQLSDGRLYPIVRAGIARARKYGMDWESSITPFIVLMFVVAPNFDGHPLIQRILNDEKVDANSRVDELWERTSDDNWDAARKNYDPAAWELSTEGISSEG